MDQSSDEEFSDVDRIWLAIELGSESTRVALWSKKTQHIEVLDQIFTVNRENLMMKFEELRSYLAPPEFEE